MIRFLLVLCQTLWYTICVVVGVRHPPYIMINIIHLANLLFRLITISIALVLFPMLGCPNAPTIGHFEKNIDNNDTHMQTAFDGIFFSSGIASVVIWFSAALALTISDMTRCFLIATHRWHTRSNRMDLIWHGNNGVSLPLIVSLVCTQLGTPDLFTLMFVMCTMVIASISELCAEELHILTTREHENSNNREIIGNVVWTLCTLQNVNFLVVLMVGIFPVILDAIRLGSFSIYSVRFLLFIVFTGLFPCLVIVQLSNQRMYVKLSKTRKDERSILPPSTLVTNTHYEIPTSPTRFPPAIDKGCVSEMYEQELDIDGDPFNVEVSERVFNRLYGCASDSDQAMDSGLKSSDGVLTVSFTDTIEFHRRSSCLRGTVFSDGVYVKSMGESECTTDSDGDGIGMRKIVGMTVEWRRYYLINIFINALLVLSLMDLTAVVDVW